MADEEAPTLDHVLADRLAQRRSVAPAERVEHQLMLMPACIGGMAEGVEEVEERADLDPEAFQDLDQPRHVGPPVDAEMEVEIRLHSGVEIASLLGGDQDAMLLRKLGDRGAVDGGQGALRREGFQLKADLAQ